MGSVRKSFNSVYSLYFQHSIIFYSWIFLADFPLFFIFFCLYSPHCTHNSLFCKPIEILCGIHYTLSSFKISRLMHIWNNRVLYENEIKSICNTFTNIESKSIVDEGYSCLIKNQIIFNHFKIIDTEGIVGTENTMSIKGEKSLANII